MLHRPLGWLSLVAHPGSPQPERTRRRRERYDRVQAIGVVQQSARQLSATVATAGSNPPGSSLRARSRWPPRPLGGCRPAPRSLFRNFLAVQAAEGAKSARFANFSRLQAGVPGSPARPACAPAIVSVIRRVGLARERRAARHARDSSTLVRRAANHRPAGRQPCSHRHRPTKMCTWYAPAPQPQPLGGTHRRSHGSARQCSARPPVNPGYGF